MEEICTPVTHRVRGLSHPRPHPVGTIAAGRDVRRGKEGDLGSTSAG